MGWPLVWNSALVDGLELMICSILKHFEAF